MTLKQAYEVFFPLTNEKVTKEFIKSSVTPINVKKKYDELIRIWHPDRLPNQSQMEETLRKMVTSEINLAREIMNWALEIPGKKNAPGNYEDLTILKIKQEEAEKERVRKEKEAFERKKLKEEYLEKVEVAYNLMYKEMTEEFLKHSRVTKMSLIACIPLKMTYQIICDSGIAKVEFDQKLKKLEAEKVKAISKINKTNPTREVFEEILRNFAKGYYKGLKDKDKLSKLNEWISKNNRHKWNSEIKENVAEINNLMSKVIARLTLAREIFENNQILLKSDLLNQLLNDELFLNELSKSDIANSANYEKRLNQLSKIFQHFRLIDETIREKYSEWQKLKNKYEKMHKSDLTRDRLVQIDEEISSLLPEDERNLLNDFYKTAELGNAVKDAKTQITTQIQKAQTMANECRRHIISQIKINQAIIANINKFIPDKNARVKYYEENELRKIPNSELAQLSVDLKNEAFALKKKAIEKYHAVCKDYYIGNEKIDYAMMLEGVYDNYLIGSESPIEVDNAYNYFKKIYDSYVLGGKKVNSSSISFKQYLICELQNLVYNIDPFSEKILEDMLKKYNERYTMNADELFYLYKQFYYEYFKKQENKKDSKLASGKTEKHKT